MITYHRNYPSDFPWAIRNVFEFFQNYRPQRSRGQGNIFTPVCHSVHRGDLPQCMLGCQPPQGQTPPQQQTPPGTRPPSAADTPPGPDTPLGPDPPDQTPQSRQSPPPPRKQTPACGLRAAGMHPTGMHSC